MSILNVPNSNLALHKLFLLILQLFEKEKDLQLQLFLLYLKCNNFVLSYSHLFFLYPPQNKGKDKKLKFTRKNNGQGVYKCETHL